MSSINLQRAVKTHNIEWININTADGTVSWDDVMIESVKRNRRSVFDMALKYVTNTRTLKKVLRKAVQRSNMDIILDIIKGPGCDLFHLALMYAVEINNMSIYKSIIKHYATESDIIQNDALCVAVNFNYVDFVSYLVENGASAYGGFNTAVQINNKYYVDYFYQRLTDKDKISAKGCFHLARDTQNIKMLEHLITLGLGSWEEVRSMVADRTDLPILMAHLDKIDPIKKEDMLINLVKEENIDKLEQLVSKSIASNLGIAFLAETLGKEKIAKYFVLKCHLDHLVELQCEVAKKDIN